MNNQTVNGHTANGVRVLAPALPASQATVKQLQDRIGATARAQNQLAAIRAEALNELNRRQGPKRTEEILRGKALLPPRRARQEIKTAQELEKLPKTREGLRKGDISHDNARIIAGANQRGNIDETELADLARTQSPDKFVGTVRKHEQKRSEDDGMSKLEHQRSARYAKISTNRDDGMTVLHGRFDPITAAAIESVLSQKMNELWQKEEPGKRPTPGQRMADALQHLITGQPDRKKGRTVVTRLLMIADYDVIAGQLKNARLGDGTPIPAGELRRLACDAQILPAVFGGRSQPLDLGWARRTANSGPTNRPHRPRPGLCGMRRQSRLVPSAPHRPLGRRRPHQPGKPGPLMQQMPPQSTQRPMESNQRTHPKTHPPPPTQPNQSTVPPPQQ